MNFQVIVFDPYININRGNRIENPSHAVIYFPESDFAFEWGEIKRIQKDPNNPSLWFHDNLGQSGKIVEEGVLREEVTMTDVIAYAKLWSYRAKAYAGQNSAYIDGKLVKFNCFGFVSAVIAKFK